MLGGLFITVVAFIAATLSGALAQEASGPLTTEMAQRRLQAYVNTWSSNEDINPSSVGPLKRRSGDLLRQAYVATADPARQAQLHKRLAGTPLPDRAGHRFGGLRPWTYYVPRIGHHGMGPALANRANLDRQRTAHAYIIERQRRPDRTGIRLASLEVAGCSAPRMVTFR